MMATTAIDQIMELIYAGTVDKAQAKGLTDDQHADWMAAIFDRLIRDTAEIKPELAERVLAGIVATTDINA